MDVRWDGLSPSGSVIERIGSAPRDPGATLAVSGAGEVAGSVTGGCVEPAVIREATEVLNGSPGRICRYGLSDDEGFDVGLTCGGSIAVAVYALDPALVPPIAEAVATDTSIAMTVRLERGAVRRAAARPRRPARPRPSSTARRCRCSSSARAASSRLPDGELVFVESYAPRPDMYIFGASDHVTALVTMGKFLGYRVTVCDARATFVTEERFPDADELVIEWPDRFLETAPVDRAHGDLHDDPRHEVRRAGADEGARRSNAGYIGAIGSEKTRTEREQRLRDEGVGEADLARLHAPIGVQIGARTPEEVAVTIATQIIESNVVARAKRVASIARPTVLS